MGPKETIKKETEEEIQRERERERERREGRGGERVVFSVGLLFLFLKCHINIRGLFNAKAIPAEKVLVFFYPIARDGEKIRVSIPFRRVFVRWWT